MGYYASTEGADFIIEQKNIQLVVEAFRNKYWENDWAKKCESIQDVFYCFGLSVDVNGETGDLEDVFFEYGKYSAFDDSFFELIAPYVAEGSYILFVGEDGSHWAFYFDGESYDEYYAEIRYPGMPAMHGPRYHVGNKAAAEQTSDVDQDALMDVVGGVQHGDD